MSTNNQQQAPQHSSNAEAAIKKELDLGSNQIQLRRKLRHLIDNSARVMIAVGGISVIVAILLIFFYLFYEVAPLFRSASVTEVASYSLEHNDESPPLHLAIEEQSEIGMRLSAQGEAYFFALENGAEVAQINIARPSGVAIVSFALAAEESGIFALGFDDGRVQVAQYSYQISYSGPNNDRTITPQIEYPFGEGAFQLLTADAAVENLAVSVDGDRLLLAGAGPDNRLAMIRVSQQRGLFAAFDLGGGSSDFEVDSAEIDLIAPNVAELLIDGDQLWLYAINDSGVASLLDIPGAFRGQAESFAFSVALTDQGANLVEANLLLGGISLLIADDMGRVAQFFPVRDETGTRLERARDFDNLPASLIDITPEQRRKNFVVADTEGTVSIFNATAQREVFQQRLLTTAIRQLAISPRGDALFAESSDGRITVWEVDNEHPEVSWSALWGEVWYEGYTEPDYIWQSSSSSNDFEPKYSLMPLSFGTLKAAFYAMLLAAPLAICGAIFTGYFMAPAMRRKVKPLIELMEALPTVVLGFLAGLWLAPFVENNLLGIFSILVILPVSILLASFVWLQMPKSIRHAVPEGWEAGLLIPVILVFGYLSFALAGPLEVLFFNGDLRFWVTNDLGVSYDQRNALVVGFAMGFAVIPTIFSIAEDAIFTVPRQLTYGSLALGATPWQSLYRVVLPTASPGIFSALMIGMGRAVGETMIVLMATGNTPIMDINIFEGMRTLAANIAVEIPESEVDSTHYRILFLAALVLFMFTFVVNTVAEVVRQRLRSKYSTI